MSKQLQLTDSLLQAIISSQLISASSDSPETNIQTLNHRLLDHLQQSFPSESIKNIKIYLQYISYIWKSLMKVWKGPRKLDFVHLTFFVLVLMSSRKLTLKPLKTSTVNWSTFILWERFKNSNTELSGIIQRTMWRTLALLFSLHKQSHLSITQIKSRCQTLVSGQTSIL